MVWIGIVKKSSRTLQFHQFQLIVFGIGCQPWDRDFCELDLWKKLQIPVLLSNEPYRVPSDFFFAPKKEEEGPGQMIDRFAGGLFVNRLTTFNGEELTCRKLINCCHSGRVVYFTANAQVALLMKKLLQLKKAAGG